MIEQTNRLGRLRKCARLICIATYLAFNYLTFWLLLVQLIKLQPVSFEFLVFVGILWALGLVGLVNLVSDKIRELEDKRNESSQC